jgi:hypothetical protein
VTPGRFTRRTVGDRHRPTTRGTMTISDEVTAAIATTHHDRGGMLDATLDLIQLTQRLIELAALERLQLGVARQHQRHHGTHTDIMRTGL